MQKNKLIKYCCILSLILGLIAVRVVENQLFYDPLINHFKGNFQHTQLPDFDWFKMFLSAGFRYFLNSFLSVFLIFLLFNDKNITKLSIILYALLFPVLMISFYFALQNYTPENYTTVFYIRRFIIQPIFLLLFLAAFYYQQKTKTTTNELQ